MAMSRRCKVYKLDHQGDTKTFSTRIEKEKVISEYGGEFWRLSFNTERVMYLGSMNIRETGY